MKLYTFGELDNKIRLDLDLQDEDFITADEMAGYVNDAIDEAEAAVLKINEDYFLKPASPNLSLVSGTATISLPTDIYAQKIRSIVYKNGSIFYQVARIRNMAKFLKTTDANYLATATDRYAYFPTFSTAGEQAKITLFPTPQESGAYLEVWYLRNANRIPIIGDDAVSSATQRATVIDLPEAHKFITFFVKGMCMAKDAGGVVPQAWVALVEMQKNLLIETLTQMVPDDDDTVEQDQSFYEDLS